ncbi:MAG: ATP-binding cassette domain-containing protein [Odoribacter sp.]|nr:ATP-binding cassette domain-containing protein [Odoribacter sp.]
MPEIIIKTEGAVIRQKKNTILKNVNLEIQRGEFIYIIGKVGSGKSSFLKTLYAELPLEYGKAEVAGVQLKKIKKSQVPVLRRKCGIVFQDFKLLTDRTVYANLEFVLRATGWKNKKAIQERIDSVLEKVEMPDKRDKMPHELSGGEQQRIVLARALLNAPPLILADEPTGNIDPETSYRLIELLKDICTNGTTVIIATHQYDLLEKYPGKVLRCDNGTLTEDAELSVPPHSLAPEAIESIENIPLAANESGEGELPSVLEADILTPVTVNPETEQPDTFLAEEEEVQSIAEPAVSENITEEKAESGQDVTPETTECPQDISETQSDEEKVTEAIVSNDKPADDIEPDKQADLQVNESATENGVPADAIEETEGDEEDSDSNSEKDKREVPFGFELIE